MNYKKCSHGKSFTDEECAECDAVWRVMTQTKREKVLEEALASVLQICMSCGTNNGQKEIIMYAQSLLKPNVKLRGADKRPA